MPLGTFVRSFELAARASFAISLRSVAFYALRKHRRKHLQNKAEHDQIKGL